jgi:two-component system nitrogen regulation response regulator NtrX
MLENAARRMNRQLPRMTDQSWAALEKHSWPGNVRELSNVMERLAIYHAGREVEPDDLQLPAAIPVIAETLPGQIVRTPSVPPADAHEMIVLRVPDAGTTFDDLEREILAQILQRAEGNQSKAARSLGLSESTLRSRLKRLGLKD